jgi:hypothetical protein
MVLLSIINQEPSVWEYFYFSTTLLSNMSGRYNLRRSTCVKKLKPQCPTGCPKDQIPRMNAKMEEPDLDISYVGIMKAPNRRKLPKKSRPWGKWKNEKPLTDPRKLPQGCHA